MRWRSGESRDADLGICRVSESLTLTPTTLVICASVHVARFHVLTECCNQPGLLTFVVLVAFVAFIVFTVDISVAAVAIGVVTGTCVDIDIVFAFAVFVVTGIVVAMLLAVAAFVCLEINAFMITQIVTKSFIPTLYTVPALF